ncbi:MAG: hypothetical protein UY11_C0029G0008 [Candidatus Amesbacteria bacterium GW2011_GWC2_47_8]|uniref:PGAP1 family protein n=1 Tax=Candidatus Amesbacteria bacterium GW2011_GWC2_47_8 TaxID=1618367 RepID=A0A0G1VY66_9BACT|nr:MAG: hypothetical protein UY11_C0029G0008 [Candidatus Amesbacteria bacterium GW2011_GWC2_47_8]
MDLMKRLPIDGLRFLFFLLILPFVSLFVPFLVGAAEVNDPWSQDASFLQKTANHTSHGYGVFLFTFAGSTTDDFSTVGRLDTSAVGASRLWVNSSNLPQNLYWHAAVSSGEYAYSLGGTQYPPQTSKDLVFVATMDNSGGLSNWRTLNTLPQRLSMGAAGATRAGTTNYVYFSGGWTDDGANSSRKVYYAPINGDGSLGTWTATTDLPDILSMHGMVAYGGYVYVIGGWNSSTREKGEVWRAATNADGTLGAWAAMPSLPGKVRNAGVTLAGNYVFVVGGHNGAGLLNTVYYTSIDNSGQMAVWQTSSNNLPAGNVTGALSEVGGYMYYTGGFDSLTGYTDKVYRSKLNIALPTPTPTPTPDVPVVVIPGMGASWNYEAMMHGKTGIADTDWEIAPFVTLYNGIINALGDKALVYPYDWRRNISTTAENLNAYIAAQVPTGQVDIVGHSMGGLDPEKVRNLITVGSPHKGAVAVYKIWEGADFSDMPGWMGLASRLLLRVNRASYANEVAEIQALFPSMRNIWPIFTFTDRPVSWSNNFLPGLAEPVQMKTIYGSGINTPGSLTLTSRSGTDALLNKWVDGKPTATLMGSGDNAVLTTSSNMGGEELAGLTHDQIIGSATGQNKILGLLGLSGTTGDAAQADLSQAVIVSVASPANFTVVDPNGNSYIPTDGLVVIGNPASGNYQVQVTAEGGGGSYNLYFGKLKGGDSAWESRTGSLGTGESTTYTFGAQMNQSNLGSVPLTTAIGRINDSLTLAGANVILKQDLARIRSYLTDIKKPQNFDTKLSRLIRTIDSLVNRASVPTSIKDNLRLVKADLEQERADRFAN